jgi:hypothetical protein
MVNISVSHEDLTQVFHFADREIDVIVTAEIKFSDGRQELSIQDPKVLSAVLISIARSNAQLITKLVECTTIEDRILIMRDWNIVIENLVRADDADLWGSDPQSELFDAS